MTRSDILARIREELQFTPDATCIVMPVWTADILQTDRVDGILIIYDDPDDWVDGTIH